MKRFIFFAMLIGLSACEFYYTDPVYSPRDRVLGRYEVEEYSETYNSFLRYTIWIERSSRGNDAIWLDNFYDVNLRVRGTVNFDKITIPKQTVNGFEVEGVGTIHGNTINLAYRVRDFSTNQRTDFLNAVALRYY
ncbi:MAG: hypothetical protein KF687_15615 [Cyclobacteriaceae bacterium]|nr:hypothetical protein [Cyclobacteriaceae bacterium]